MDRSKPLRRPATVAAAVAVVLALCALLPAAAAADTTSLTAVASPEVIPFDGAAVVTGTLVNTTTATPLGGLPVLVESALSGTGPSWTTVAVITTLSGSAEYASGTYSLIVHPSVKTFYRMTFRGAAGLDAAGSAAVSVTPGVWLSRPKVPVRVSPGQRFRVTCYIQPWHPKGSSDVVQFRFYRYTDGKWALKASRWATTSNYLNFSMLTLRTSIKVTGKWKVKALAPDDAGHAESASVFSRVFTVR